MVIYLTSLLKFVLLDIFIHNFSFLFLKNLLGLEAKPRTFQQTFSSTHKFVRILLLSCLKDLVSGSSDGKATAYNAGDLGSIPGSGRSPGEGNGNPLQYSCLENPMDGGAW